MKEKNELNTNYDYRKAEKMILNLWQNEDYFNKLRYKNKNKKKFKFIDGPITANNPMGIHHAWGRTLKDTFLRYKAMNGYYSHYRNGFDGQGLWVEVEVEKELGFNNKKDIEKYGLEKFTNKCIERVNKYSKIIEEQSKLLGQWMDWDNSYYTYTDENITSIWAMLKKCDDNNWIKQIFRPMPWCTRCGTSLSEHEMSGSYREMEHEAVYIKLPIIEINSKILVWTTTPWTLPANVALAVNPDLIYYSVEFEDEETTLIMSENYYNNKFKGKKGEVIQKQKGEKLEGLTYETCFPRLHVQENVNHRIVLWEDVVDNEGSGVVHIATGCGVEDYELGKKENLNQIICIDEDGKFLDGFGFLTGKDARESNELIFMELKLQSKLFYSHKYTHSYPVCWRCKSDILYRTVSEWVIEVKEIRQNLIKNAKKVNWNPDYQRKRMLDWLDNMSEWNISRKRFYGLPLPFYKCDSCGKVTVIGSKEELREKAIDRDLLDNIPHLHRPWIDDILIECSNCKSIVKRISEVGDVWLDAGIVPFSTIKYFENKNYWKDYFPAEFVIEMKEQVRLWFYSMLFMSTVLIDEPPFERVETHGMVTAEDGSKFSKTGFMIRFDEAADRIGADASRYIFASSSKSTDVRFGYKLGDEAKRKIISYYNIPLFFNLYAKIDKPNINMNFLSVKELNIVDKWLVTRVNDFIKKATNAMEKYTTKDVISEFEKIIDDISNFYIRVNRRRFWKGDNSSDKLNAYIVLFYAIKKITQIIAPIIPFVTEYIWQNIIKTYYTECEESVHLSDWPKVEIMSSNENIIDTIELVRKIVSAGLNIRNRKHIKIRQPLRTIYLINDKYCLSKNNDLLNIIMSELNVKQLVFIDDKSLLEDFNITLNYRNAGTYLKQDIKLVNKILSELDEQSCKMIIDKIINNENIVLEGYNKEIPSNLFLLNSVPKKNISMFTSDKIDIALDCLITEDLEREGLMRDLIRFCQVMRKEAGFEVSDKISISFDTNSNYIRNIICDFEAVIESELLAKIKKKILSENIYTKNTKLKSWKINISISNED